MIGSFNFNTVESSYYSLVCKSVKRPLLPAVKVKRIELPGTSGAYDFPGNEYSLRTVTMKIAYIGTSYQELRSRARSIAAWLSTSTWAKLILNDEPDKYYLARVTNDIDLDSLWESGTADVVFDCQPFAYAVTDQEPSFIISGTTVCNFTNPGTRVINNNSPQGSKFKIEVAGTFTDMALTINGKSLIYGEPINGFLVIDNIEMTAFLGSTNKFSVLSGAIDTFLSINAGANALTIGGTTLNVTMTVKYTPLWY